MAGWAFMTIPGLSPLTPAIKVPSMVVIKPSSSSCVFSPKYQTLPPLSWANQSRVSSVSAVCENTIADFDTGDPKDHFRVAGHCEFGMLETVGSLPPVDEGCSRLQREVGIINHRDGIVPID